MENEQTDRVKERNRSEIWRDFWIVMTYAVLANLLGFGSILLYQVPNKQIPIFWGLACTVTGGIIGFLFGIPRVLQHNNTAAAIASQTDKSNVDSERTNKHSYEMLVNTNLEQISDWLTKIIVGVGLIELRNLPIALQGLARYLTAGFENSENLQAFAATIVVYFSIIGFIVGYLLTRIYLSQAFSRADWGAQNTFLIGGQELTQAEFLDQTIAQISDLQEQVVKTQTVLADKPADAVNERTLDETNITQVKSVLWVDDNPKNNSMYVQKFNEWGINVEISLSTEDALQKIKNKKYDRVISDMGRNQNGVYDEKAGINLFLKLKEENISVSYFIFCSGALVKKYGDEAMQAGVEIVTSSFVQLMKALKIESN